MIDLAGQSDNELILNRLGVTIVRGKLNMSWENAHNDFLESDVIEWREAIWSPNRTRRKKRQPWGTQAVTGQIIRIDGDFIVLKVLRAKITESTVGTDLSTHKIGTTITKKRQTLLKGGPVRLHWSEEDVRTALLAEQYDEKRLPA
jgi:hypothetical protein